ncbi:MAG: hypothetical protein GXY70_06890 [Euryarchaeota archaeon]|nr:hypothetical protein [Euryarchaeota archaeon]
MEIQTASYQIRGQGSTVNKMNDWMHHHQEDAQMLMTDGQWGFGLGILTSQHLMV